MRSIRYGQFRCLLAWGLFLWALAATSFAEAEKRSLLVMGDSLSAGYGIEREEGWVSLLRSRLREQDVPVQVINASVSGETSAGGAKRLQTLLDRYQPFVVLLELGGNDGLRGQPLQGLRENLSQMIEQSQAAGAQVLLVGMQIPPNYGKHYTREFARIYPELAEQYQLPLVDFLLEGIATDADAMQSDGIHPKAEAQPEILDNVWPSLKPLLSDETK